MGYWKKITHLFSPNNNHSWMVSHAANPVAVQLNDNKFKVYFTTRNASNVSHIASLNLDMDTFTINDISSTPILEPGSLGMFDDSGVAMGWYIEIDQVPHIYYLGWNLKVTVPWLNTIGLAKFDVATNQFEKVSKAPIMDRSHEDPFSISYPSVMFENGLFRMWYGSNLSWGKLQHEMKHVFKYAESQDGYHWIRHNTICLNLENDREYALSKPCVLKTQNGYEMWYSYRASQLSDQYRIGLAVSKDGKTWQRCDSKAGIEVSETGWDSEMICYPYVFEYKNEKFMLYNGNGYGQTGFGIAKWMEE